MGNSWSVEGRVSCSLFSSFPLHTASITKASASVIPYTVSRWIPGSLHSIFVVLMHYSFAKCINFVGKVFHKWNATINWALPAKGRPIELKMFRPGTSQHGLLMAAHHSGISVLRLARKPGH